MGFIHDIRRILPLLPRERQTLFFSATMPDDIVKLANTMLRNPAHVTVTPPASVVETIRQSVLFAEKAEKRTLLASLLTGVLTDAVITEISVTGSLMIIGITLNVLGVTKLRILNMTPALLLPVLLCKFM